MAKKIPSNFYQEVNVRKLNNVFDSGLPAIGSDDNGKVVKVVENKFALSEDLHTTVVANPEGSSTDELMTLKVGETIYAVNKPSFDTIKAFKITTSNGGQYCTSMPKIEFLDIAANIAPLVLNTDYTIETEHPLQYGSLALDAFPGVTDANTPNTYTITFVNAFNTEKYNLIKLTRGGSFPNDIAKNIKIELSVDGTNFITIYDETSITWSDAVPAHLLDFATGEEASTLLPIVTSADSNTLLQVDSNGVWNKGFKLNAISTKAITSPSYLPDGTFLQTVKMVAMNNMSNRITVDTNGYYEVPVIFGAVGDMVDLINPLTPEDFDTLKIGAGTPLSVFMLLNDGAANINLFGQTVFVNNGITSASYAGIIRGSFMSGIFKNQSNMSEVYTPYDCTISYDPNVSGNKKWNLKFKLAKITTT